MKKYKKYLKPAVITSVILLIPFFYVFFFLKAFWNPYDNISNIPVAVINLDNGEVGKEIVKKLEESNTMKIVKLENDENARVMLKNREFYSSITIPENFTDNIKNLKSNEIIFRSNKKYNYIASQIYERAAIEVEKTVRNQISNTIAEKLHGGIETSAVKIEELNEGLGLLNKGSIQLFDGVSTLNNKYNEFDSGILKLNKGISTLNKGVDKYIDGVNQSVDGLDAISKGVLTLGDKLKVLKLNKNFMKLYNGAKKVQTENIRAQIKEGGVQVRQGLNTLNQGSGEIKLASTKVKEGILKIENGSKQLTDGVSKAHNAVEKSSISANQKVNSLKGLNDYIDTSINLKVENIDNVPNYGSVFAAYFMSISLWVGSLVMMIVMYYDAKDRFELFDRNYENKYIQYLSYLGLIVFQGALLTFLVTRAFDFEMLNMKILWISMTITDLAFFSMVYFFILLFDDFGKFISVILLIVQISASAGTFPIETAPEMFIKIFPLIPMRYSVSLFKEAFAGYDSKFFIPNFSFILGVFVVFSLLTIITIFLKRKISEKSEKGNKK